MAASIRGNNHIQGIKLPSHGNLNLEARISQFVDDTQLFCKNETSVPHIFKILSFYERASETKMNKSKTIGLFIGRIKRNKHTFNEINWTRKNVKTLSIHHGYEIDDDAIWMEKINKIKNCLSVWKMRNLTYQGKVLILKTFVVSIILYEIETVPSKSHVLNKGIQ